MKKLLLCVGAALLVSMIAPKAVAQEFPRGPVRIIVMVAPGGNNDIVARLVADRMAEKLGHAVIVENRPGGPGIIAAQAVKTAEPNGQILLLGNTTILAINISSVAKLPYNPVTDFAPVAVLATTPSVLVVNSKLEIKTVGALISLLKSNPGKYSFGSGGTGTPMHLSAELFKTQTGTDIVHVPYKGSAPALVDLLSGQVQMMFDNILTVLPHIRSGAVRPLATTGSSRLALLPDVPTVSEAGFAGAESASWFGLVAPAGTPPAVIQKLNEAARYAVADPEITKRFLELGAVPWVSSPEEMAAHIKAEIIKWSAVVKASHTKID